MSQTNPDVRGGMCVCVRLYSINVPKSVCGIEKYTHIHALKMGKRHRN